MDGFGSMNYIYIFSAIALIILYSSSRKLFLKKRARSLLSIDRIARMADVGEKDIVIDIKGSYNFWAGSKTKGRGFVVCVFYAAPMSLKTGERNHPMHHLVYEGQVDEFYDQSNLESKIAEAICGVKHDYQNGMFSKARE